MKNPKFKKAFDKSYKEFLLSELLIAIMENDEKNKNKRCQIKIDINITMRKKRIGFIL